MLRLKGQDLKNVEAHMVKVGADEQMFLSAWTSVIFETVSLHHSHQSFKVLMFPKNSLYTPVNK